MKTSHQRARRKRSGTTVVEVAVILPVFMTFVFGLVEYGRLQMVNNLLKTATRSAARLGSTEGVTTAEVEARVDQIMGAAIDANDLTVIVKDAGVFDSGGSLPSTPQEYAALPDMEVSGAEPRQLFLVRATVAYNDIALIPFSQLSGVSLTGQAFMRHE